MTTLITFSDLTQEAQKRILKELDTTADNVSLKAETVTHQIPNYTVGDRVFLREDLRIGVRYGGTECCIETTRNIGTVLPILEVQPRKYGNFYKVYCKYDKTSTCAYEITISEEMIAGKQHDHFNGKIRCKKSKGWVFTEGKIYDVINGIVIANNDYHFNCFPFDTWRAIKEMSPLYSFELMGQN